MVKITNGNNIIEVSRGAYETIYKSQGYNILNDNKNVSEVTPEPQEDIEEDVLEELKKKPLSKWSKAEVKAFAIENNIDISGTKNVNEAKDIIYEYLEG